MMTELWTPSDDVLTKDPVAIQQIANPHDPSGLEQAGLHLPDVEDDATNEAAAVFNLAEADGDNASANGESGECADDDEVGDTDADYQIEADI